MQAPRRKTIILIAVLAVLAGALRLVARELHVRRFGVVQRGVLYRSGQPTRWDWWVLTRFYGIRTVVNLRPPDEDRDQPGERDWYEKELAAAKTYGLRHIAIPIPEETNLPSPEQVDRFLNIVDEKANRPVLVHCEAGADRAGAMVAAWRMRRNGWNLLRVVTEMEEIKRSPVSLAVWQRLSQLAHPDARNERAAAREVAPPSPADG